MRKTGGRLIAAPTKEWGVRMEERRGGCFGGFLKIVGGIVIGVILLSFILNGIRSCNYAVESRRYNSTPSSTYTSSAESSTQTSSEPSTWQFGDDAEQIVKDLKESLGSKYKYSWTASGYKLTFTVKIQELSGDDLADLYAADAAEAQKIIDNLNESMKSANSGTLQRFKTLGYKSPTVVFSMVTSDDMEVCTVTNGRITHSITKDNFRYG